MILSIIFWALAAFRNAVMDMTYNMYRSSVFTKLNNPNFWCLVESSKHARRILSTAVDAWHIAKLIMLGCFIGSIGTFTAELWVLALYPIIWGLVFELSLKLLKK